MRFCSFRVKRPLENSDSDAGGAHCMLTKPKVPGCHIDISLKLMRYLTGI
jgi:hypothetical protein